MGLILKPSASKLDYIDTAARFYKFILYRRICEVFNTR